ncbi:hypothetical protein BpHYR1_049372 [Brachionus plicatilis]|uniref:Uncharacterized protein n=1 Tax=Brachionus plicatilis TaxID=10195 RepID=A0A3M7SR99_BRAPC|nr:hypothetical protein BpHYR1_049372 [Brachionus plicatilis]
MLTLKQISIEMFLIDEKPNFRPLIIISCYLKRKHNIEKIEEKKRTKKKRYFFKINYFQQSKLLYVQKKETIKYWKNLGLGKIFGDTNTMSPDMFFALFRLTLSIGLDTFDCKIWILSIWLLINKKKVKYNSQSLSKLIVISRTQRTNANLSDLKKKRWARHGTNTARTLHVQLNWANKGAMRNRIE